MNSSASALSMIVIIVLFAMIFVFYNHYNPGPNTVVKPVIPPVVPEPTRLSFSDARRFAGDGHHRQADCTCRYGDLQPPQEAK